MFAYLKGILADVQPGNAIIEVSGVGYILNIPSRLIGELPPLGQIVQFYTSFVVRESSQTLFGFINPQERDVFEVLMNVTGIGPKMALSLIGHLSLIELQDAVSIGNVPVLCKVPGVGKRTAERLIVELKDKLSHFLPQTASLTCSLPDSASRHIQDAILALINLGYNQNTAQKAIKQTLKEMPETEDLALLIMAALKNV